MRVPLWVAFRFLNRGVEGFTGFRRGVGSSPVFYKGSLEGFRVFTGSVWGSARACPRFYCVFRRFHEGLSLNTGCTDFPQASSETSKASPLQCSKDSKETPD